MIDEVTPSTAAVRAGQHIQWVARTLAGLVIVGFLAGVWATSLAGDVEANKKELEEKASVETVVTIVETLRRIERKIDHQTTEQRTISRSVIRLETKVEALEKEAE